MRGKGDRGIGLVTAWVLAWVFAGAFYLLLIDITDLPELIVGAGAALLAAIAYMLAREEPVVVGAVRARWLARLYRPLAKVPGDIGRVGVAPFVALLGRRREPGEFRAIPFAGAGEDTASEAARRALAEALGSFAPNTIIIGVDRENEVILAHQLQRTGGSEAIDLLDLGSR